MKTEFVNVKTLTQTQMVLLQNPDQLIKAKQDLFLFQFPSGQILTATDGTMDITVSNPSFHSIVLAPGQVVFSATRYGQWKRGQITTKIGSAANSCDLDVIADSTVLYPTTLPSFNDYSGHTGNVIVNIDAPSNEVGQPHIYPYGASNTITFNGWAIAGANPIVRVACFLDGNFFGNTTYGTPRPDVAGIYPGQSGSPNLGWSGILSVYGVTPGMHVLTITAYDSAGNTATAQSQFLLQQNITLLQAINKGMFETAKVFIFTAYMESYGDTSPGLEVKFVGTCGEVSDGGRAKATIKANDLLYPANLPVPSQLYTSLCRHVLYDNGCTVSKAAFSEGHTVSSSSGDILLNFPTATRFPAARLAQGQILWSSGNNTGLTGTVRSGSANQIMLYSRTILPIQMGDSFTLYAGCDRTTATCGPFFDNLAHYAGFPFIPSPEVVL